ncbi:MAG: tRNA preQ1(34) S-adenosylmethionine ribosyltransferase-isomerase QueA [bacterium]|nr:MAG: tRNA preQ1(34) S-adenosylmethionine ribosyltransferase-isomerase QueA [bacterium]
MKLSDFDYDLPKERIAQYPASRCDESRMMLLERKSGGVRETRFSNFPRYLQIGDLLVVNETKVIPARIFGRKATGGRVEIFLTHRLGRRRWSAMLRPARRLRSGGTILVGDEDFPVKILDRTGHGEWTVQLPDAFTEDVFLRTFGHVPLPPYIKREDGSADTLRYQTIFARREGSVAAPTAGLHFTDDVLRRIRRRGVTVVPLALHVGPGTFRPLPCETVEENTLEPEYLLIKREYWEEIRAAKRSGRRIVAVGTTTTRALESLVAGPLEEQEERIIDGEPYIGGWAPVFIYPGFRFRIVDAMLTNLHLPRSSLLLLVSAFAGCENVLASYRWAVRRRFRFYSYGDCMFIR